MYPDIFAYLVHKLLFTWMDILSYGPNFFQNIGFLHQQQTAICLSLKLNKKVKSVFSILYVIDISLYNCTFSQDSISFVCPYPS
jgi:hypothetical protein